MQLKAEQLGAQIGKSLAAVYVIHGDEPLLALEAADAVRAAARKRGFTQREVFEPGRSFDWSEFAHAAASQSLFGERKLIELRLATGKPAASAARALVEYCGRPSPDAVLLVTMPRPEGAGWWKSDWFGALDAAGTIVEVQPVARAQLPAWISQRLALQKQRASREVLDFLAERVEGNLLAAHQELQKLALLAPEGELSLETVEQAVASVARYDPYAAVEALLAGDTARYLRVMDGLQAEGEPATLVLFVVSNALFALQSLQRGIEPRVFNRNLQRALQGAGRRYGARPVERAIAACSQIDRAIKGVGEGDPWERFTVLALALHLQ